jgi:oxygen-dependent protoporphyrinogen oxidase
MARLPERLAEELGEAIRCGAQAECVSQRKSEKCELRTAWRITLANGEIIDAEQVVFSVPAYEAARMIEGSAPALARELNAIDYAPMSGVSSGYDRSQVKNSLDGFGFMVPRKEGLKTICAFWNSSLFPERAPEGRVLMTSFVRSESDVDCRTFDADTVAQTVEAENAAILGITGQPTVRHVWNHPRALPQYNVGHGKRVAASRDFLPALCGLHLAGNYLKGRSIGDCVELAFQVADNVDRQLRETNSQPVARSSEE